MSVRSIPESGKKILQETCISLQTTASLDEVVRNIWDHRMLNDTGPYIISKKSES